MFSTLDCLAAFWAIPLSESSKPLTAFSIPIGFHQFAEIPFGLHGIPVVFSRLMAWTFGSLTGSEVLVCIANIIVLAPDVNIHRIYLRHVLELLKKASLKLKVSKCEFLMVPVDYLGHAESADGIPPNANRDHRIFSHPRVS